MVRAAVAATAWPGVHEWSDRQEARGSRLAMISRHKIGNNPILEALENAQTFMMSRLESKTSTLIIGYLRMTYAHMSYSITVLYILVLLTCVWFNYIVSTTYILSMILY